MFNKNGKGLFNKQSKKSDRTTILDVDSFGVNEAYKLLRTNLLFAMSTRNKKTMTISSSFSGEGKSITSANIAISMAQMGSKVLLVDCDLRSPVQHKVFKIGNEKGVSTVLGKMTTLEESIHKNITTNFDVLPCGPIPPNPSEMVSSNNMKDLIEQLSDKYDYVVLDTAPLNLVSDALALSKLTGGLVLVCRQEVTTYDDLKHAIGSCNMLECDILGMVINSVADDKSGYGRNAYKYKYSKKYGSSYYAN